MTAVRSAFRTGLVATAAAAAIMAGSAVAAASADGLPLELTSPVSQPTAAQPIYTPDSGSAVINILNLLTGSADRPCNTPITCG
ncbi:hypothetical protein OHB26_05830 [Nocardia sp. NBC_01503]|uniref:hypothetical protein n=1 Tax=Nocardia sp. NBC_01503 TaxID=2975997 RepID=UPI002E7B8DF2|nr:hypothetical protein [Nocardia sp. NBC_01503]WTL33743.1 hypothetical protein OHB26_05830 [Nocardia sp. NBC_01503]